MKLIENGSKIDDPEVVEYMRMYAISTQLHIPPASQDDQPAVALDWLLKIHGAVAERQRKESGG